MNKHQVMGRIDSAKGRVEEVLGRVLGNDRLQAAGKIDRAYGRMQTSYGDARQGAELVAKNFLNKIGSH
jgi:uncharacterized protein YjbJ (UPF0337 family)